jgi:N-acetylglutamate synthase-like GNAT family acetyltransferase
MINIRRADYNTDIVQLINRAKKAGVSMYNPAGAFWLCGEEDGVVFACTCCVINAKTNSARWKSDFTLEEYRGRGTFKRMLQLRLNYCLMMKVKEITAFVRHKNLNLYLARGFKIVSTKPKVFYVSKEL